MKKWIALIILSISALGLSGCGGHEEKTEAAVPMVRIAYAAYQYDQDYALAEGWMYDMTISAERQIDELNELLECVRFEMTEEEFTLGTGYRLTFQDAQGNVTRDLLLLGEERASIQGSIYRMENAQPLAVWLSGLHLDEQSVVG